jgi:Phospholipase_D-nuclease N-terminal
MSEPGSNVPLGNTEHRRRSAGSISNHSFHMRFWREGRLPMFYDVASVLVLLLDIWALISILQGSGTPVEKLIWVIIILVLPLVGFILWYLIGPGSKAFPLRR